MNITLISGVIFCNSGNKTVCKIESLSNEFEQLIREELSFVLNGQHCVDSLPERYTYQYALKTFLDRYDSKDIKIQMGMIGEILCHVLLNKFRTNLTNLSIWKNKEERSIKKDLISFIAI